VGRVEAEDGLSGLTQARLPVVLTNTDAVRWRAMGLWTPQHFCSSPSDVADDTVSVPVFKHTCVSGPHARCTTGSRMCVALTSTSADALQLQGEDLHLVHRGEPDGRLGCARLAAAPREDETLPLCVLA
jgi:hypothetical protein